MSGTSEKTTPVNVRVDNDLKVRLDGILKYTGRTLTSVLRRYLERMVYAWEASRGEPADNELILFLTAAQFAQLAKRAKEEHQDALEAATNAVAIWGRGKIMPGDNLTIEEASVLLREAITRAYRNGTLVPDPERIKELTS